MLRVRAVYRGQTIPALHTRFNASPCACACMCSTTQWQAKKLCAGYRNRETLGAFSLASSESSLGSTGSCPRSFSAKPIPAEAYHLSRNTVGRARGPAVPVVWCRPVRRRPCRQRRRQAFVDSKFVARQIDVSRMRTAWRCCSNASIIMCVNSWSYLCSNVTSRAATRHLSIHAALTSLAMFCLSLP